MRLLPCIFLLLAALALRAQDVAEKRRLTLEELKKFYADEKDRITTAWIDMEGSKEVWASFTKAGYLPVFAEGKWEQGTQLHRIGYKSLQDAYPGAEGVAWYCYYGMEQDSFDRLAYRVELPLHETTYKWSGGKSVSVFDSSSSHTDVPSA